MKPFEFRPVAVGIGSLAIALSLAIVLGVAYGLALGVLVLAATSLGLVLVVLFSSVRNLSGQTPLSLDEALGFGAPSAEEEQKRSLLRALKDLEYERSVGKISEEDYQEFSARYREEAKRIILRLDERLSQAQEIAEKLARERVLTAGLDGGARPDTVPLADATESAPSPTEGSASGSACAACGTENDPDARFCKRCGTLMEHAASPPEGSSPEPRKEESA